MRARKGEDAGLEHDSKKIRIIREELKEFCNGEDKEVGKD